MDGAIDAVSLANLIRSLLPSTRGTATTRGWTNTGNERIDQRYILRCRDGLELIKRPLHQKQQSKRQEDEGFESDGDDDSASTRSLGSSADDTVSNSSSCCFVDDHVFKCHSNATTTTSERPTHSSRLTSSSTPSCVSSVATDSANSSGASDTEDTSAPSTPSPTTVGTTSVAALVKTLSLFQQRNTDTETSKQPPPPPPTPPSQPPPATTSKDEHEDSREVYSVNEIAFCHTDPSFQRVVVWVVKKKRPLGHCSSGSDTAGGLEAIVFECSSEENMKKLIQSFHETSRRFKLEQYRHPHRRKDIPALPNRTQSPKTSASSTLTPESIIKALKEASQKSPMLTATAKPVIKPIHLTTRTSSKGSGPGSEVEVLSTVAGTRFNLVQRTDGDGVTHIEVSRGLPTENPLDSVISLDDDQHLGGPSSIISISTPDIGNLLSTSSNVGNKTRFCKEIEGVIRSDVDVGGSRKEVIQRQRQPAILVMHSDNRDNSGGELRKVWSPPTTTSLPRASVEKKENNTHSSAPPQRPERRRYARKNKAPAPQPPTLSSQITKGPHQQQSVSNKILPFTVNQSDSNTNVMTQKRMNSNSSQQLVVKGQFIRVSVDQQQQQQPTMVVPALQQGTWIYGNNVSTGNLIAYSPAPTGWGIPVTASKKSGSNTNHAKSKEAEDSLANSSSTSKHQQPQSRQHYRKSRSRSRNVINGSHRSKSPPVRRPMAYRYIDTVPVSNTANFFSNRFFGLSQKLREIGGAVVSSSSSSSSLPYIENSRRRNSIGDLPARFECLDEGYGGSTEGKNGGNLKSVIKKNRRIGEYSEPKKVTFSAYATVQVVD